MADNGKPRQMSEDYVQWTKYSGKVSDIWVRRSLMASKSGASMIVTAYVSMVTIGGSAYWRWSLWSPGCELIADGQRITLKRAKREIENILRGAKEAWQDTPLIGEEKARVVA